jgi:hypothetical protein
VDDVGADGVEETCVVAHHQHRGVRLVLQALDEPVHRGVVEVVRRLVQQHDVGLDEDAPREGQLHAPTPAQRRRRPVQLHVVETQTSAHQLIDLGNERDERGITRESLFDGKKEER